MSAICGVYKDARAEHGGSYAEQSNDRRRNRIVVVVVVVLSGTANYKVIRRLYDAEHKTRSAAFGGIV